MLGRYGAIYERYIYVIVRIVRRVFHYSYAAVAGKAVKLSDHSIVLHFIPRSSDLLTLRIVRTHG